MTSTIVQVFKTLLKIGLLDEDEEKNLESDIRTYTAIVNSSKYADSNSDTDALEKLVRAIQLNAKPDDEKETSGDSGVLSQESTTGAQESQDDSQKVKELLEMDYEAQLQKAGGRKAEFMGRLTSHLKLLNQLEGERAIVMPGQRVYQGSKFGREDGSKFILRQFSVPDRIYNAMEGNSISSLDLTTPLTLDNYVRRFQTLLWVEEAHQAIEMRRYDMIGVLLGKHEDFFVLAVPGLAEGRPSLLRGDRVILKSDKRSSVYEGYIFDVRELDILIKLHVSLHSTAMDGLRFDVSFLTSRTSYRRCHHGVVQLAEDHSKRDILFPNPQHTNLGNSALIDVKETTPKSLRCFSECLNIYQRRAVLNVLRANCRPAPYVIFGPPGTGKTVTMVESILQVYARTHDYKILVCGNSNACADILATRLKSSGVIPLEKMVRISAFYRMEKLIPPELEDITKTMDMICSQDYKDYRVVITTCISAGTLNDFTEKFDYVFIDEAGHANEPEALIPIGLMKRNGCTVLAGDPHQLGPVCTSHITAQNGFATSLLERLCKRQIYQKHKNDDSDMVYDSRYLSKLIISYRADPRVMVVNNKLFYDDELQFQVKTPQKWLDFLHLEKPLVFHQVKGKDLREYTNPSWFNPNEAITCLGYAKRLFGAGLKPNQLGIITPYRRQIEKLNILFDSCQLPKCKITTMEEFQGDEREVIIISTVRTRTKNIKFDQQFNLGFLFNPKRFNVAVSRAKWLVIVIGNPDILSQDSCWAEYLAAAQRIETKDT